MGKYYFVTDSTASFCEIYSSGIGRSKICGLTFVVSFSRNRLLIYMISFVFLHLHTRNVCLYMCICMCDLSFSRHLSRAVVHYFIVVTRVVHTHFMCPYYYYLLRINYNYRILSRPIAKILRATRSWILKYNSVASRSSSPMWNNARIIRINFQARANLIMI